MKVGDLVRHDQGFTGIITCVDPEQVGDYDEVEVAWTDVDFLAEAVFRTISKL